MATASMKMTVAFFMISTDYIIARKELVLNSAGDIKCECENCTPEEKASAVNKNYRKGPYNVFCGSGGLKGWCYCKKVLERRLSKARKFYNEIQDRTKIRG